SFDDVPTSGVQSVACCSASAAVLNADVCDVMPCQVDSATFAVVLRAATRSTFDCSICTSCWMIDVVSRPEARPLIDCVTRHLAGGNFEAMPTAPVLPSTFPRRGWGTEVPHPDRPVTGLLEETKHRLRRRVGLGEHRRTGLHEDLVTGEVHHFQAH